MSASIDSLSPSNSTSPRSVIPSSVPPPSPCSFAQSPAGSLRFPQVSPNSSYSEPTSLCMERSSQASQSPSSQASHSSSSSGSLPYVPSPSEESSPSSDGLSAS